MTTGVVVHPFPIPTNILHLPSEALLEFVGREKSEHLVQFEITDNMAESLVEALDFHLHRDRSCDTVVVFREKGTAYHMSFLDLEDGPLNMVASMLHNECHKVYGKAAVVAVVDEKEVRQCDADDILRILHRRAWHTGVFIGGGGMREVEVDNAWNVRGADVSLRCKHMQVNEYGYLEIMVEAGKYLFAFLDENRRVLVDLRLDDVHPDLVP